MQLVTSSNDDKQSSETCGTGGVYVVGFSSQLRVDFAQRRRGRGGKAKAAASSSSGFDGAGAGGAQSSGSGGGGGK